ncbi:MAG: hypothetical protein EDM77_14095 [Candidatus Jettenia sp. AMX1]|nr:MAG: hypothetical protein EDM77_14095 [Candidatus Jettenia sp. AMX1]
MHKKRKDFSCPLSYKVHRALCTLPATSLSTVKEELVNGKLAEIKGEDEAETTVSYFKGNDPSKWWSGIATYGEVNLGEVYEGIELRLKAYGDNVEKLFCVKPGADPGQIQVRLSGVKLPNPPTPFRKWGFYCSFFTKGEQRKFFSFIKREFSLFFESREFFPLLQRGIKGDYTSTKKDSVR